MKLLPKLTLLTILVTPYIYQPAQAFVDPKSIFNSYSQGSAGTYDTSQGRYWHGGSFTGRINQTGLTGIRVSPPSIKMGCNGIDIFAGSFGLVSGDELVQVARGAAQGAGLYFFNLAMSSVCPSCKEVMDNISKKIEQLNQWGRNSCESAIKLADKSADLSNKFSGWGKSVGMSVEAEAGNINSWFDDNQGSWGPDGTSFNGLSEGTAKLIANQNLVYTALKNNYSNLTLSTLGVTGLRDSSELIQSIFGTVITQATTGGECTSQKANDKECLTTIHEEATMKLESFVFGIPAGTSSDNKDGKILTCTESDSQDPDCVSVTPVAQANFKGLFEIYSGYLKGTEEANYTDGIFQKIQRKDMLDDVEQIKFINSYRYPWVKMAIAFKGESSNSLAEWLALSIAEQQINDIGVAMRGVMNHALLAASSSTKQTLEPQGKALLETFDKRLEALNEKIKKRKDDYKSSLQIIKANQELSEINKG